MGFNKFFTIFGYGTRFKCLEINQDNNYIKFLASNVDFRSSKFLEEFQKSVTAWQRYARNTKGCFIMEHGVAGADSENFVTLVCVVLIESQSVTNGRTDRQTDTSTTARTKLLCSKLC